MRALCLIAFLICVGRVTFSQSITTRDFKYYCQVANKYEINPPDLEYGYPWWFDADSLPVSGIIFLKEDLAAPLEKLSDTSWVARPTVENAKEIAAFSDNIGLMPKYLIVPDSGLTYYQVRDFLEVLLSGNSSSKINFFSSSYKYSLFSFLRPKYEFMFCGDGIWGNMKSIIVNPDFDFMIDHQLSSFDSIINFVYNNYTANFESHVDQNAWSYHSIYHENILLNMEKVKSALLSYPKDTVLQIELHKLLEYKKWVSKYDIIIKLNAYALLNLRVRGNELSIAQIYSIYDKINKGLLNARLSVWENYTGLFAKRQFDRINYIHTQMPDLISDYKGYAEPKPIIPPKASAIEKTPLPEDSEIYKALMLESKDEPINVDTLN